MKEIELVSDLFRRFSGQNATTITGIQASGSDRKYFRINNGEKSIVAAFNRNEEENRAFVGFTNHFISKGLRVPEILADFPDQYVYFLRDLGDTTLFNIIRDKGFPAVFDNELVDLYKKSLDNLILFQLEGIKGLDTEICYPHKSFDRQSMMWDMNYFKYMFLKLVAAPFNEKRLEHDFKTIADHLLEADQNCFLYRDFQSANIMVIDNEPWFIDYQGGRLGAPQYDAASLIYDAKAHIPINNTELLKKYFIEKYTSYTRENPETITNYFSAFSLIRLMQALGTFGFRGLYEKKPTFTESLVPGVNLILYIIDSGSLTINVPELVSALRSVLSTPVYRRLNEIKPEQS